MGGGGGGIRQTGTMHHLFLTDHGRRFVSGSGQVGGIRQTGAVHHLIITDHGRRFVSSSGQLGIRQTGTVHNLFLTDHGSVQRYVSSSLKGEDRPLAVSIPPPLPPCGSESFFNLTENFRCVPSGNRLFQKLHSVLLPTTFVNFRFRDRDT